MKRLFHLKSYTVFAKYAREITKDDPYMIGRIIARPYVGEPGNFQKNFKPS